MASKKKITLIVLGAIAAVMVALVVLASVLITPERVREAVVPLAESALDRQVTLGGIDVSLFSGISLQDVTIREKEGTGDDNFVAAEKVVLRYSLIKLLLLKVDIDEMTLVKPRVTVIRNRDGSFNFSDLAGEEKPGETSRSPGPAATGSPIQLQVSRIGISDGRFTYIDKSGDGQPVRYEVAGFNLAASNVALDRPFPVELSADWDGNVIALKGSVDPVTPGGTIELHFNRLSAQLSGQMPDGKIKGTVSMPESSFKDILASIPKAYAPQMSGKIPTGKLKLSADINNAQLRVSNLSIDINDQLLQVEGTAENLQVRPIRVSFAAKSDALDIDRLMPPAAENSTAETSSPMVEAEIGPFDLPLELNGTITVGKVVYNRIPVTDLKLKASLKNNILKLEQLSAAIAGGVFHESGSVNLGVKGLSYATAIDLKGIQGKELVQLVKPELAESVEGVVGGETSFSGAGTIPATVKKNLSGQGTLRLAEGKLQKIPALNAVAALLKVGELREVVLDAGTIGFILKDGQVNIDSQIAGPTTRLLSNGQVSLDGRLDLRSRVALSPELGGQLREQGRLAQYLGDEKGWTTVPLRIKGDYASPDVGLDSKEIKKHAETAVKNKVQKSLEKGLEKGLKKLFGN